MESLWRWQWPCLEVVWSMVSVDWMLRLRIRRVEWVAGREACIVFRRLVPTVSITDPFPSPGFTEAPGRKLAKCS